MSYSKKQEFKTEEIIASEIAKALSHPARIAIIKFLAEQKSCICNDIVEQLPLSQSTVFCYCIDKENWKKAKAIFSELFNMRFSEMKKCC
jgi:ArsR family transcriptional regulator, arsenate/arsenite/antimonite-responsive transcriptional repressor